MCVGVSVRDPNPTRATLGWVGFRFPPSTPVRTHQVLDVLGLQLVVLEAVHRCGRGRGRG